MEGAHAIPATIRNVMDIHRMGGVKVVNLYTSFTFTRAIFDSNSPPLVRPKRPTSEKTNIGVRAIRTKVEERRKGLRSVLCSATCTCDGSCWDGRNSGTRSVGTLISSTTPMILLSVVELGRSQLWQRCG